MPAKAGIQGAYILPLDSGSRVPRVRNDIAASVAVDGIVLALPIKPREHFISANQQSCSHTAALNGKHFAAK
jgi:hypothetical protein